MITSPEHAFQEARVTLFKHAQELDESLRGLRNSNRAPNQNIEDLDGDIYTLHAILHAFDSAAKICLTDLRRRRNRLLPIYSLPPEILILIMDFVVDAESVDQDGSVFNRYQKHYNAVSQLGQISSLFRTIITSTSQFWTKIDGDFSSLFVEVILQRSLNAPLEINIESRTGLFDPDYQGLEDRRGDFYTNILKYCSRWKSFRISVQSLPTFGDQWLTEGHMPLLEGLELSSYTSHLELPNGVKEHAPRLSHLKIMAFNFPLGCSVLTRLESICMTSAIDGVALSLSQWQLFLSSAPQLKSIITYGSGAFRVHPGDPQDVRIHMPKLERLAFHRQSVTLIGSLLCSIIPAQDSYPHIVIVGFPEARDGGWIASFPELVPDGCLLSKSIRKLEWIKGGKLENSRLLRLKGGISGSGQLVTIDVRRYTPYLIQLLIPSFGALCLLSVKISDRNLFGDGHFVSGIRCCSRLKSLVLSDIGIQPVTEENVLEALCVALATPSQRLGVVSWPCPNLRLLDINSNCSHFPSILQLVKTRYGSVGETGGAPPHPHPVFLESLRLQRQPSAHIRSENPGEVKELEAISKQHGTFLEIVAG